jgi:hypothetical protein
MNEIKNKDFILAPEHVPDECIRLANSDNQ